MSTPDPTPPRRLTAEELRVIRRQLNEGEMTYEHAELLMDEVHALRAERDAARKEADWLKRRHVANITARDEARAEAAKADERARAAEKQLADLRWNLQVPEGAKRLDAWEYEGQLLVFGDPPDGNDDDNDPSNHNCDVMGCGSFSHVIIRERLKTDGTLAVSAERDAAAERLSKLPQTADGVPVVPGMRRFCPHGHINYVGVDDVFDGHMHCCQGECWGIKPTSGICTGTRYPAEQTFSTHEAALRAAGATENGNGL